MSPAQFVAEAGAAEAAKAEGLETVPPVAIPPRTQLKESPDGVELWKYYKPVFDDVIFPLLMMKFNWTLEKGQRPNDNYYMPPGVKRGVKPFKTRIDFFDSSKQVLLHLLGNEEKFGNVLQAAWEAAVVKQRQRAIKKPKRRKRGGRRKNARHIANLPFEGKHTSTRKDDDDHEGPSKYQVDLYPPGPDADGQLSPNALLSEVEYTEMWIPCEEVQMTTDKLNSFMKDYKGQLEKEEALYLVWKHGYVKYMAAAAAQEMLETREKPQPFSEEEMQEFDRLILHHCKDFGKIAADMPGRQMKEVKELYYREWK
ncbi:unnamed protein product, partial [Chrysoparadoxa australica]